MFEKTCKRLFIHICDIRNTETIVTDLIRGLRANKKDEQRYIQHAILECKKEARSQDLNVKAGAMLKLTYLAMFGQDMGWASFHTVEVMASPKFVNKRIGYMAASQGFRQDTDVLMLATNLMKKDIASSNPSEVSVALGGLGDIVSPDLARDLSHDLVIMLSHSKATVRKKAVLVMYKIFLQYPEALRASYPKLRERLEDEDSSVVSATVNVIVELSRKNPKNYLPLAPSLFELLTTSSNNWMLIKIIKLFAALTPLEPRLVKKLITPLTELIQSTSAMSLLYECINTVISGDMLDNPNSESLAQLCIMKLRTFFEQDDQNLKYVGLIAFTKVIETHPHLVNKHQDVVLACIDDSDISIRMRALELVSCMPSKKTLPEIVRRLVKQLLPRSNLTIPESYRKDLILRLLRMCNSDMYKHVEDFDWYVAVLIDLVKIAKVDVASQLRDELRNVCVRVKSVRVFAIPNLATLLGDRSVISAAHDPGNNADVLASAAWAVGEYNSYLEDSLQILQNLLSAPFHILSYSTQIQYLQAIPKLYCRWTSELDKLDSAARSQLNLQTQKICRTLEVYTTSSDIEVQQRAVEVLNLMTVAEECIEASINEAESEDVPQFFTGILPDLFFNGGDLNPIAPSAQRQISVPSDLDLELWIDPPTPEPSPALAPVDQEDDYRLAESDDETREMRRRSRRDRYKDDPYYIQQDSPSMSGNEEHSALTGNVDLDTIPIISLDPQSLAVKRRKRRPLNSEPVEILNDEVPEGFMSDSNKTGQENSLGNTNGSNGNNVLRVDGSKLSAFDLDAQHDDDEQSTFEAYQVISEARKASKKAKEGNSTLAEKPKKKKKKKTKQEPVSNSNNASDVLNTGKPISGPSGVGNGTTISSEPDVVEVVKRKKKKSKPVDL